MSLRFKRIDPCIGRFRRRALVRQARNVAIALPILESVRIVKVRDK